MPAMAFCKSHSAIAAQWFRHEYLLDLLSISIRVIYDK